MQKIQLQPGFVIHTRAYRDTSLIVEFFTPNYGRLSAVVRGVRKRKSPKRSLFNPFIPLLISIQGKGSLKLLTQVEAAGEAILLVQDRLFAGMYINELLNRLLLEWDAHEGIYHSYCEVLPKLQSETLLEPVLRHFETQLLQELGYGIDWLCEASSGKPIMPGGWYRLDVGSGFILLAENLRNRVQCFQGEKLLAIAAGNYHLEGVGQVAKQINRLLLQPLLGSRPLQARALFQSP